MKNSIFSPEDVKILVIDDNLLNLELVEELLKSADFKEIVCLSNPLQVKNTVKDASFDLVLLDINMPVFDGFAVLSLLFQELENQCPPVLMVTAQGDTENRLRAFEEGASDYITKPFNRQELLKRIEVHLENWLLRKQLLEEKASLDDRVKRRTDQLLEAQMEIVSRLGRASEYRDNETGNHVNRVSLISELIAKHAGYCDKNYGGSDYCELIRLASPMHDIGKIGIQDEILLKPGKLSKEEYQVMQQHVEIGADILSDSENKLIKLASEIIMSHHEKFDGSGYPAGLSGKDIPLSGRIVAIADVYDALTSVRPYKKAWPFSEALALIVNEKGKHFDPELVDIFVSIFDQVKQISDQYSDA